MKDWIPSVKLVACTAIATLVATVSMLALQPKVAEAESLETLLPYVIENHDRVRASKARLTAARNRAREALGAWYPTLGQTANAGHERQQNDNGDDSSTGFHEWDIKLTQLLWDFGSTNGAIDKARLRVEEARYTLIDTRQSLILEAITAYMNAIRSNAALKFAIESEDNIRRQTGLEEALVGLGSGFSTDVLQAKTQLAGAQARRAQSEGGLASALNRFKAVYGLMPSNIEALEMVPYPAAYLPQTLTQASDIAFETNPSLKNAILASDIAVEDVRIARANNFAPKFEGSAERKFKKNVGGTIGSEQETLAKVEMTFDFNLGFTAINTLRASESDLSATTYTAADTRRTIEEQVRNAWQQLDTAKKTASHLSNQANIAAAFLELARNERQLGRRSLIDVLSGETNLINAKSDALSAETDVIIAAYGMLAATGQLEYDIIKNSKGVLPPTTLAPSSAPAAETPQPAPALPVTPATGQQNGEIEPDVTVTGGRSLKDMQAAFAAVATPDVAALADTITYYGPSQSGQLVVRSANLPPAPKSRFASFDSGINAGSFTPTEVAPEPEFASSNEAAVYVTDSGTPLPSDSDTGVTPQQTPVDEAADLISMKSAAAVMAMPAQSISEAQAPEIASLSTAASGSSETTFSFSNLITILEEAHQASLDTAQKSSTPAASLPEPDPVIIAPAEQQIATLISDTPEVVTPSIQTAATDIAEPADDPLTSLFSNIVTFLETAQPSNAQEARLSAPAISTPVIAEMPKPAPLPEQVEVAAVTPASHPVDQAEKEMISSSAKAPDTLSGIFTFFDEAHKRSQAAEKKAKSADIAPEQGVTETSASLLTTDQQAPVKAHQKATELPDLFTFLGDVFSSEGALANVSVANITSEPYQNDFFDKFDGN